MVYRDGIKKKVESFITQFFTQLVNIDDRPKKTWGKGVHSNIITKEKSIRIDICLKIL